ncbi:hypothetical protein PF005_g5180 [Phytophthora fragariae]|uniref:FYVE-type domain-containing protein n=1 Tax=Phytophthora fragariae TaxID=53985 RepID=A0A6A3UL32_9STRA|nr:hypothetical protein PF003_g24433 [Phytophthora fragariae]KAE8944719.1 hypothetical protein PF009_g5600 [Phytophthora fragariae]KAE9128548.1 hypothetical protein PF010_g4461 [Phytophthora fragariae]KAE9128710.1 hypothetical protein PF007_g5165 [Phytophthora fragariae]KAE9151381.1 hypothetical protein PF006_g4321 [Phytophthora fragariae]
MSTSANFPIARVQLPTITLSRLEQHALKRMITRMLQHTVREIDQHTHANGGVVDTSMWKPFGSRDGVRVFREREAGATSAALAFALGKTGVLPRGSTVAPLAPAGVLMTGLTRGKVENVMDAVCCKSQQDLALVQSFMHHEAVVDCAVLHTIEAPTETDPFHFLGIKYVVRKAPAAGTTLVKHRDAVYLEFTGYTETTRGERLGFHLMHSVELAAFPPLTARHSMRTLHSVRYVYRQQSEDEVEVFMQGNLDTPGMAVKPLASPRTSDALFGVATLIACAEAKRLTQMWRAQQVRNDRQEHRKEQSRRASTALECSMCRRKKKLFGGASLVACELCAQIICSKCHTDKRIFEMDASGILGKFRKVSVCKCCVLAASKPLSQPEEPQMRIVMSEHMQLGRRRRGASSSGGSGSRSRSNSSRPSASSEDYSPASQAHRRGRNDDVASSVSSRSDGLVPVPPMGMNAIKDEQAEPQQQQRQLTLREHHRIPLQLSEVRPQHHRDYALRRVASTGSTFTSSNSNCTAPSSDLLARMIELNRVAESTYNTTQQNGIYLSQQMRTRRRT